MVYKKHYVGAMQGMIQRCIMCGEIISDYTHCMWPNDQAPPKGFDEGELFVSSGNPRITTTTYPMGEEVVGCIG